MGVITAKHLQTVGEEGQARYLTHLSRLAIHRS